MKDNLDYYEAIAAARDGHIVKRKAWGAVNKHIFIFARPADTLSKDFIPNMKSLPESVKDAFKNINRDIKFTGYICLFNGKDTVENAWQPSSIDRKASDWYIADEEEKIYF